MAFKVFSVNETLTSSDANEYFAQQQVVIKTADESVTSSTTVQDDNHLSMTLNANTNYWLDGLLLVDGAAAGDFKLQFVVPSGTIRWLADGPDSSAAATTDIVDRNWKAGSLTTIMGTIASGTTTILPVSGIIRTAASGGTFKLQWAQGTSSATATRVFTNSFLRVTRMKV
jgi:hypothetical protein